MTQRTFNRGIISVVLLSALLLFSCASSPEPSENSTVTADYEAVVIPIPKFNSRSYFASIDKEILEMAENGSPSSIKRSISLLHKSDVSEYSVQELVLINTLNSVMQLAWPSETVNWEIPALPPEVAQTNPYSGAIDSVLRGIYDYSTGNSDFFTILLPSLLLLTSSSRTDYYADSRSALTTALSMHPNSVLANYLMGVLLNKMGSSQKAETYLNKALADYSDSFEIRRELAVSYYNSLDYDKCFALSKKLLETDAHNVELLSMCSVSAYSLGLLDKAEEYVLHVLQLQPENLSYVLFRARILVEKQDYVRASSLLDVYAKSDQSAKDYLLMRAKIQKDWNKNNSAAAETIGRALYLYPQDVSVLLAAASIASSSNINVNGKSALELSEAVLKIDSENTEALSINIEELIKRGDWRAAYTLSSRLVKKTGASLECFENHIEICLELNYSDEAWRYASDLYERMSDNEDVLQVYIKTLVQVGRRSQAADLIARLLPTASSKLKSFLYYQRSYFATSDDDILSDLRASLTANPRNRDALYRLYEIYYGRKDWRRAQYYLKQVVALEPSNAVVLQLNAELDTLQGR